MDKNQSIDIKKNINELKIFIGERKINLIAVTKNQSVEKINEILMEGIRVIGENYLKEAQTKFLNLPKDIEKHFIGHLQKNKVKLAVKLFDVIQTVDSYELAEKISIEAQKQEKIMEIFFQINISNDPQKFGIKEEETLPFFKKIFKLKNLKITGLMTILENGLSALEIRNNYKKMKKLFDKIKIELNLKNDMVNLSMGMSSDYEIAIEEGSNMIRIGTKIFGERKFKAR